MIGRTGSLCCLSASSVSDGAARCATPAALGELDEIVARMAQAAELDDVNPYTSLNLAFHDALARASGNAQLHVVPETRPPVAVPQPDAAAVRINGRRGLTLEEINRMTYSVEGRDLSGPSVFMISQVAPRSA